MSSAPILLDCITTEADELVKHKALRGLGRLVAANVRLDRDRLVEACEKMIVRALLLIQIRSTLENVGNDATGSTRTIRQASLPLPAGCAALRGT